MPPRPSRLRPSPLKIDTPVTAGTSPGAKMATNGRATATPPIRIDDDNRRTGTPLGDIRIQQKSGRAIATPTNAANFNNLVITLLNGVLQAPTNSLEDFKQSLKTFISQNNSDITSSDGSIDLSDQEADQPLLAKTLQSTGNPWLSYLATMLDGSSLDTELRTLCQNIENISTESNKPRDIQDLIETINGSVCATGNNGDVCLTKSLSDTEVIQLVIDKISQYTANSYNFTDQQIGPAIDIVINEAIAEEAADTYNKDAARAQVLDLPAWKKSFVISGAQVAFLCTLLVYLGFSSETTVELPFIPTNSSMLTNPKTTAKEAGGWMALIIPYTTTSLAANVSLIMLFVYVDFIANLITYNLRTDTTFGLVKKFFIAALSILVNLGDYQAAEEACESQIRLSPITIELAAAGFLVLRSIAVAQALTGPTPKKILERTKTSITNIKNMIRKLRRSCFASSNSSSTGTEDDRPAFQLPNASTCAYSIFDFIRAVSAIMYTIAKLPKINAELQKHEQKELRTLNSLLDCVAAIPTLTFNLHWTLLIDLRDLKSIGDCTVYIMVLLTGTSAIPVAYRAGSAVDTMQIINLISAVIAGWNMNAGPILALKNKKGSAKGERSWRDTLKHIAIILSSWLDPAGVLHWLSGHKHAGLAALFQVNNDSIYKQLHDMEIARTPPRTRTRTTAVAISAKTSSGGEYTGSLGEPNSGNTSQTPPRANTPPSPTGSTGSNAAADVIDHDTTPPPSPHKIPIGATPPGNDVASPQAVPPSSSEGTSATHHPDGRQLMHHNSSSGFVDTGEGTNKSGSAAPAAK